MKVIGNLKIQNGGRSPCWIFMFAVHNLHCCKSVTEENIKFVDYRCNRMKIMGNLKIKGGRTVGFLNLQYLT